MITLVNFSDPNFRRKQRINSISGKLLGGIDTVIAFNENDLPRELINRYKNQLTNFSKGFGNFFWKPYFIQKALESIKENEYLIYTDSGTVFLKSVHPLLDFMEKNQKDIMTFQLPLIEKQWTKRDAFVLLDTDSPFFTDSNQIMGGYILLKNTEKSRTLISNWNKAVSDYRILGDNENVCGKENYPEFIEHRHDQAILSLLCKKMLEDVLVIGDISDYAYYPYRYKTNTRLYNDRLNYPFKGIILATRSEKIIPYFIKYVIRRVLLIFNIKK